MDYGDFRGYIEATHDSTGQYFVVYLEGVGHIFVENGVLAVKAVLALTRTIS